jgi:hypothetical protein
MVKPPNPRRAVIVVRFTPREARALLAAVGNSLTTQFDAESICGGKTRAAAAFSAEAKLRESVYRPR